MTIKNTSWLWLLTMVALCAFVGCSDDDDDPVTPPADPTVTETIGATGGTLTMPDEMSLMIPAGALADDVEFVAGPAETPPALPAGYVAVSDFFDIQPSGTDFGQDALLTLFYDEGAIPQFITEDDLYIYTHDGTEWDDIKGTVDMDANSLAGDIGHLSVFVVVAPEPEQPDDVYLEFSIERHASGGFDGPTFEAYDELGARFASNAPTKADDYLNAGTVTYGEWEMQYAMGYYWYSNDDTPTFFEFGTNYDLVVEGSLDVTPLTLAVATMAPMPVLSNLADEDELDLEGFTLTWDGTSQGGDVEIYLYSDSGGEFSLTTDNDGSYTFTAQELASLTAGEGDIELEWYFQTPLPGEGYLEASRTKYETSHEVPVVFTGGGGGEPETTTVTSYPGQTIPDGPSGGGPGATLNVPVSVPVTGTVEGIRVYLDISHTWMSDLICKLRSPDGTELRVLFIGEGGETDGRMQGWYPDDFTPKDDLAGFNGDAAGGTWTLICNDYSNGAAGVLNEWRLEVTYR